MPSKIFVQGWCTLQISPQKGCKQSHRLQKNPPTPALLPCSKSILGVPVQTSLPASLSPLTRASFSSPKPHIPGAGGKPRKTQVLFQAAPWHGCRWLPGGEAAGRSGARRGVEVEGERSAATRFPPGPFFPKRVVRVLHPNPARRGLPSLSQSGGADGAPAGRFLLGWGCSSHMQPLQTQTALSPAGAEQVGLFIWEELICCRSIIFPPKPCAARCLDHFSLSA